MHLWPGGVGGRATARRHKSVSTGSVWLHAQRHVQEQRRPSGRVRAPPRRRDRRAPRLQPALPGPIQVLNRQFTYHAPLRRDEGGPGGEVVPGEVRRGAPRAMASGSARCGKKWPRSRARRARHVFRSSGWGHRAGRRPRRDVRPIGARNSAADRRFATHASSGWPTRTSATYRTAKRMTTAATRRGWAGTASWRSAPARQWSAKWWRCLMRLRRKLPPPPRAHVRPTRLVQKLGSLSRLRECHSVMPRFHILLATQKDTEP